MLANLIAGVTAGQTVAAIGFGSGAASPSITDTVLTASPAYYNAIISHSFPSVEAFNSTMRWGQVIMARRDNDPGTRPFRQRRRGDCRPRTEPVIRPGVHGEARGLDSGLEWQSAALHHGWNDGRRRASVGDAIGATTSDGSAVWTLSALHTAPGPMIAHVSVPAFPYNGTSQYSGTWTLTF